MSKPPGRRVELDPNPPAYKTPLPSLPRAPRLPSDLSEIARRTPDTDPAPAPADSGEYEVSDAEKTPTESPYSLKRLSEKMDEAIAAARDAANNSLTMMSRLDAFGAELKALTRRVSTLEGSRQWGPWLLASLALAGDIWLAFRVQDLQHQLQELQRLF